jgi:hypothetical protein
MSSWNLSSEDGSCSLIVFVCIVCVGGRVMDGLPATLAVSSTLWHWSHSVPYTVKVLLAKQTEWVLLRPMHTLHYFLGTVGFLYRTAPALLLRRPCSFYCLLLASMLEDHWCGSVRHKFSLHRHAPEEEMIRHGADEFYIVIKAVTSSSTF